MRRAFLKTIAFACLCFFTVPSGSFAETNNDTPPVGAATASSVNAAADSLQNAMARAVKPNFLPQNP